jgi:hypothetical protein
MYNHLGSLLSLPSLPSNLSYSGLHGLEVVGLLDLGLALLAHRLPELLALLGGVDVVDDVAAFGSGQVDRLLRQGHLGRERVGVSRGEEEGLGGELALGGELSLLLGFRWEEGVSTELASRAQTGMAGVQNSSAALASPSSVLALKVRQSQSQSGYSSSGRATGSVLPLK